MTDLARALRDASDAALDAYTGQPPSSAAIRQRIRQRRTARASAVAVAVVALGAAGFAGSHVDDWRQSRLPVATPVPSSTATSSVVVDASCGVSVSDLTAATSPAGDRAVVELEDDSIEPGASLVARITTHDLSADAVSGMQVFAVRDGVVVALADTPVTTEQPTSGTMAVTIPLNPCAGGPVDTGGYALYALIEWSPSEDPYLAGPWTFDVSVHGSAPTADPPAPTGPPAIEDLVITSAGIGSMHVGDPVPATPSPTDLIRWDPEACVGTDSPGRWRGVYPDLTSSPFARPLDVRVEGGTVHEISIGVAGARTARGVQVGSTLASVREAYPDATLYDRNSLGEVVPPDPGAAQSWVVTDATGTIVFEVGGTSTDAWAPDEIQRVLLIRAVSSDDPSNLVATWGWGESCG